MVDNYRISSSFGSSGEKFERSGDSGYDPADIGRSLDLEAIGAVVGCAAGIKKLVELGHQSQEIHGPMVAQPA